MNAMILAAMEASTYFQLSIFVVLTISLACVALVFKVFSNLLLERGKNHVVARGWSLIACIVIVLLAMLFAMTGGEQNFANAADSRLVYVFYSRVGVGIGGLLCGVAAATVIIVMMPKPGDDEEGGEKPKNQ